MNILITGYSGFVGTNLTNALKNHTLLGVDIIERSTVAHHFSLENLNDCTSADAIIHLAGKAHDTKNTTTKNEYYGINVGLTKKIFQHFLDSQATIFIFFSSVKAVADWVQSEQLTEEKIPNPQTPYGKSKLEAEEYILSYKLPPGKKVFVLRPCMIHGPGNKGNLNLLYKLVSRGIPWPLGAFENNRSFTSIDNLIFVIRQLLEKDIEPGVYNMADDEPISTNRLTELIAKSKGKKARKLKINPKFIRSAASIGDKMHLPLNSERLKKLTESYVVSNCKLKNTLGIKKMPIDAEEGLIKTLRSF